MPKPHVKLINHAKTGNNRSWLAASFNDSFATMTVNTIMRPVTITTFEMLVDTLQDAFNGLSETLHQFSREIASKFNQ